MCELKELSFEELIGTEGGRNILEWGAYGLGYTWHAIKDFNDKYIPGPNAV